MQPNRQLITIGDNLNQIKQLLSELVLYPRINALKWSKITQQTPNIKIGYPGQHLASLITGMPGERTGARGHDLADGSEVKSCSRIDQLDQCEICQAAVSRSEQFCPECGSEKVKRKEDSKWLFTIKSDNDLRVLTQEVRRVILILGDYPNFEANDFETLRFQCFEIWTQSDRHKRFKDIMTNYYDNIYLPKKQKNLNNIAPQNFWPYQYQFYLRNPILTFSCLVHNSTTTSLRIEVQTYIEPDLDRSSQPSLLMPAKLLNKQEKKIIITKLNLKNIEDIPQMITEEMRHDLPLRKSKTFSTKTPYQRRKRKK
ncbi:MamI family restriction endonuclease [Planktothrix agardhii]|uniref:MamI family restriction endonuclease n=1 Tax=Planktothrix agardhii TaxID=1160 RepID=UPI002874AF7A|nr:MamI family restriction endonuclease [Planktothrix agardhii]MDS1346245.1 MamI family restriction endonuclease [Planktothrix agardhii NRERC-751]